MKKFLLIVAAVCVASVASAQKMMQKAPDAPSTRLSTLMSTTESVGKAAVKVTLNLRKVESTEDGIFGSYVVDGLNTSDLHNVYPGLEIKDEANPEDAKENVCIYNLGGLGLNLYGTYDEAAGTITCKGGAELGTYTYTSSSTGSEVSTDVAIYAWDTMESESSSENITFTVNDDGSIMMDQEVWQIVDDNYYYAMGIETAMYKPNGTESLYYSGSAGWQQIENDIYAEDFGSTVNIYGFIENLYLQVDIVSDTEVSVSTSQNLMTTPSTADKEVYGEYYHPVLETVDDEGYIHRDFTATSIPGTISGNTTISLPMLGIASDPDADLAAYGMWMESTEFVYGDDATSGIANVTNEDVVKTGKTYNVAGQQVDNNYRGIVIRDGKKFINK